MKTKIIYEDREVLVCRKPIGLAVQTAAGFQEDMVSELKNYLCGSTGEKNPYLGVVHRLDQPVEGLLVFGKTKQAAAALSSQLGNGRLEKSYVAVLEGALLQSEGTLTDYLKKDNKTNSSKVVPETETGARRAELFYQVLAVAGSEADVSVTGSGDEVSAAGRMAAAQVRTLVKISIRTGRHHQIRVQMAHAGCPLAGDRKYGSRSMGCLLALCAAELAFDAPGSGVRRTFSTEPENPVFREFYKK